MTDQNTPELPVDPPPTLAAAPVLTTQEMQNAAFYTELARGYDECETNMRFCYLSLAGKHPYSLSYLATTLALYQTLGMTWIHYIQPMYLRLIPKTTPKAHILAARVWKLCHKNMIRLKIKQEIHTFIKDHYIPPDHDNPMHPIKKLTEKQKLQISTLQSLMGAASETLPAWGFRNTPWTPETSHRYDPFKGNTDVVKFGRLAAHTLKVLRILLDNDVTLDDASVIYVKYRDAWKLKNSRARRGRSKKASRASRGRKSSTGG